MITKKVFPHAGKRHSTVEIRAQRPQHTLSNDRVEFFLDDTRMYHIGEKDFDADTYDKMFGLGKAKVTVLPKGTKDPHYFAAGMLNARQFAGSTGRKARR